MNVRQAIQSIINNGPADNIMLFSAITNLCDIDPSAAVWGMVHEETARMEAERLIVRHSSGCWTLPMGVQMEAKDDKPQTNKLRPGTSVPRQYAHLVPTKP